MNPLDILRPRTESVALEITSKCNLRCCYCPKADDTYEALPGSNADMSDSVIDAVYEYCKRNGVQTVSLSGTGETAMSKGWHTRLARFLDDPQIGAHLVSNFVRLFDDDDLVALTKLRSLQISFDSADIALVRRLRSKADLRTISYNILRLRQKMTELGRGPYIFVNCTLWRENVGHLADLAGFCRQLGINTLLVTEGMALTANNPHIPAAMEAMIDADVVLLAQQIIAAEKTLQGSGTSLLLQGHLAARIDEIVTATRERMPFPNPAAHFHRAKPRSSACRMPWTQPFVRADGSVLPCCMDGESVGHLAKSSLDDIIDGTAYRAVRASILEGRPTVPCNGCSLAEAGNFAEFASEVHAWQLLPSETAA